MSETRIEQLERLEAMSAKGQQKWDLSPNDEDAIRFALTLIRSAVTNARGRRYRAPQFKWALVRDAFAVGSTSATDLCDWVGVDPDEQREEEEEDDS